MLGIVTTFIPKLCNDAKISALCCADTNIGDTAELASQLAPKSVLPWFDVPNATSAGSIRIILRTQLDPLKRNR